MNDLDALIAEAEALEESTRDQLLGDGVDEGYLAELASEFASAHEPRAEHRVAFGQIYRIMKSSSVLAADINVAPKSCFYEMKLNFNPGDMFMADEDHAWFCDAKETVFYIGYSVHPNPFMPVAPDSWHLAQHLHHEIERAAQEIVERTHHEESSLHVYATWSKVDAYLDPVAHIDSRRLYQVVCDAVSGATKNADGFTHLGPKIPSISSETDGSLQLKNRKGRRTSVFDG